MTGVKVQKARGLEFSRRAVKWGLSHGETRLSQHFAIFRCPWLRRTSARSGVRFFFWLVGGIATQCNVVAFEFAVQRGAADAKHLAG